MENFGVKKTAGIDQILGTFLRDGARLLTKLVSIAIFYDIRKFSRYLKNRKGKPTI